MSDMQAAEMASLRLTIKSIIGCHLEGGLTWYELYAQMAVELCVLLCYAFNKSKTKTS